MAIKNAIYKKLLSCKWRLIQMILPGLKQDAASKPTLLLTVNFGSGQTGLSKKSKEMLDGIVSQILENPEAKILVVGHADGTPVLRGHHRSNWDLSQARVQMQRLNT